MDYAVTKQETRKSKTAKKLPLSLDTNQTEIPTTGATEAQNIFQLIDKIYQANLAKITAGVSPGG
ncbi:MAG: hypothetical protein ACHP65_08080 [Legionellales bacterium]